MHKKFHNVLLGISVLPALLVLPAMAADPITDQPVFVFGDVQLNDQHVSTGAAAFGGRRMDNWVGGKYQNDFPKYQMLGRSFSVSNSEVYVGPVTLTLRELTDDAFSFNYQKDVEGEWTDTDLAADAGVAWNDSLDDVVAGVASVIGASNAQYTAPAVYMMSRRDNNATAGLLSFSNTTATVDGATINADAISVTNGSVLNIVKQNNNAALTTASFFTNPENIDSDGITNLNADTINISDSTLFINTGASVVFNASDMATLANVTSSGNKGVIENLGNMTISGSSFSQGSVTDNGGVIYNYIQINDDYEFVGSGVLTVNGGLFDSNTVTNHGGAIYNYGIATIDGAVFTGNKTTGFTWESQGGAIFNSGDDDYLDVPSVTMSISNTTFGDANDNTKGNSAIYGGAIANESSLVDGQITLNNVKFYYNTAYADTDGSDGYTSTLGGAIWNQGEIVANGNTIFKGNTATGYNVEGGAIYNSGTLTFNGDVTFDSNIATDLNSGNGAFGGAISNSYSGDIVFKKSATFTNNKALSSADEGTQGGAINNQNSIVFEKDVSFVGNQAVYGGAVFNEETLDIQGGATFTNNTAMDEGGALFSYGGTVNLTDVNFTSNTASSNGGAIANYGGDLTFAGTNTFSGNTAGGVANDIYNLGALTFANGSKTTMDGGITGDGALNIADGATLNIGTASIVQSELTLGGTINATLKDTNDFAFFDIADSFESEGTGTLNFDLRAAGEYNVFQGAVLDNEHVVVSSTVFDYDWNDTFDTITATMKSVEDIADENGLSNEAATTVANLVNSSSEKLNDLADAIQDKLVSGDSDAAATVEHAHAAIHPETESVVQSVAMSVQNTVANLASHRLMLLNMGRNGGDVNITNGGIWVQGIYNKSKQNGAFNGYTRGIAGGADMTLNRALTLGAGYSYAHSDISGTARDTEVESSTLFVYGQYKPTHWFMNALANYTMSDYSEHAVVLGTGVDANYDVHAFGGQFMTGYDFAGGITPSVGVRYMHITADEYKNSLGIKNKLQDSDYMTAMLETKWTHGFRVNKQFMLRPELRYAVKYDFMSDKQMATVTLPGIDSYAMDGTRLSRLGAEVGGGLGIKFHGLDVSLNYDLEIREGFTSQTGRARIRCEF